MTAKTLRSVLATATGLLLVAALGVHLTGGGDAPRDITVTMADAGPIQVGNDVRSSGVRVGSVTSMDLVDNRAKLVLQVDPAVLPLHDDASVTIRPANLLGEDYLDLDPGSDSAPFARSTAIPVARAHLATTVQDLLDTFQKPTAAALAGVVTTTGEGLQGNGKQVAAALGELTSSMRLAERLGAMLSDQNVVLSQLVASADPVAAAIATEDGKTLDSLLASTRDTLKAVTAQQEALRETIDRLPGTLVSARRTLAQFEGVADQATPTLRSLHPLTGNLDQVVKEIEAFDDPANRALTSLEPVLDQATKLLDEAAPAVAQLTRTGGPLARAARSLRPVSDQLLDKHLSGVMAFVRKWALSTNGRDGISHYFRGVFYVTPTTLRSLLKSFLPTQVALPKAATGTKGGAAVDLGTTTNGLLQGLTGGVNDLLGGLTGGLLSGHRTARAPSAFGLTSAQERSMVQQLLGGEN